MASWNCVDRLIEAVASVRRNTEGPWRMFVQDNDSEDGAAECMQWLYRQTKSEGEDVPKRARERADVRRVLEWVGSELIPWALGHRDPVLARPRSLDGRQRSP